MINLVDETLRERRNIRDARRTVGNAEKSNGRSIKRVTVKIKIASPNDAARPKSRMNDGTGRIIIKITVINASAKRIVG